ncbi:CehA/McbA family metallohydrolase [Arsenicitalea aurantiaca]|nr:CehA/McbA family metallohydrolase [Arsenicitalea aurantiaca]
MLDAFSAPGRFLRGNLHTHSDRSDGALPPAEVCRRYRQAGYDFLCISDHFLDRFGFPLTDTTPFRTEGFTTLLGAELHGPQTHLGDHWHILAVGLPSDFAAAGDSEAGPDLARRAREAGAFVGIAHPQWYGLNTADGLSIDAAHAVEIYNHTCEMLSARPDGVALLDQLLQEGRMLTGFAADDAHFKSNDPFGGWVMVKAEDMAPETILEALKAGRYYASQGPQIHDVRRDGDSLVVTTSPVRSIALAGRGARSAAVHGDGITEARLALTSFAGSWCRLVVTDGAGRRAWAQPARID